MSQSRSLKQLWVYICLVAVVIPMLTLGGWFGFTMFQHRLAQALSDEHHANTFLQLEIDSELRHYKTLLENKSDPLSFLLDNAANPRALQQINELLKYIIEREPAIHEVIILSPQAKTIAVIKQEKVHPKADLMPHTALPSVDWLADINPKYESPEVVIPLSGRTYVGTTTAHNDTITFSIAVPVGRPSKAILIALIDVKKLWQSRERSSQVSTRPSKANNYMLDRRGTLLTELKGSEYAPRDLMTHMPIARAALINKAWPANRPYNGAHQHQVYGTLTTIPSLNWTLISEVSATEIIQPIIISLFQAFIVIIFAMSVVIWFVLRLVNKTIVPIQDACDAIERVASGRFELQLRPPGILELDMMTQGITRMAQARQGAEQSLKEKEQDLAITLNSIGDAVITTNAQGHITLMNPVAEQLTGWAQAEAKGMPLITVFPIVNSLTHKPIESPVERVIKTGETIHLSNHTTLISKDGTMFHIADSAAPIINNGVVTGVILVFNDVTQEYKVRESLKSNELEQREILGALIDAVITIDETGAILTFNRSAELLFGYQAGEIAGKNISLLMPKPTARQHDGYIQHYIHTGEARIIGLETGREVIAMRKNEDIFPMRLLIKELPEGINGRRRFVGSCHDLTSAKQQEEQLRRSQKMDALGKLTGGVAHDFNNILSVILGYSELLKNDLTNQSKLLSYVDYISHAGERGAKLTKKLLSFSRNKALEAKKMSINELLLEQQDMLQKTLTVAVALSLDLEEHLWPTFLDSNDLENAILNMCINAMHSMESNDNQPTLTIRTRNQTLTVADAHSLDLVPGDYVLLSLIDNGTGIDEDIKEKIFDPFFSTKGEQGTGLGLYQIYGLVKRAGGAIKVYSESGEGSNFTLYFPRHAPSKETHTETEQTKETPLAKGETILVVDDEAALRDLTREWLEGQGYNVLCAANGKQALKVLESEPVALLLSDIIMPEMDGAQLATIVQDKYPNIKIQLASGFSRHNHDEIISDSLRENLLHKPYHSQSLFRNIRALLDEDSSKSSQGVTLELHHKPKT
ncbi:MAG: PAS domain S-box protein [Gammaproteobacteria bacterium]|nr:PAS domain S-box protein [Gammaproteobacteria bacterium]